MIIVNPNHRNTSPMSAIEPPIWCAYIARYLKADRILDAEADGLTVDETVAEIGDERCVLVAMGANPSASSTPKMGVVNEIMNELRRRSGTSASVAGLHPQGLDAPLPVVTLSPKLREVTPNWDLIDFSKYRAHNWHCLDGSDRGNYGVVYSSFGCPFNCFYCNIHTLYSGITYRKPQDVVDEIGYLVSRGVKNLKFCDELFVLNEDHVTKICDGIKDFKLNIWAYARSDTVNPKLLRKLKEAGFNWLAYGFESSTMGKGSPYDAVRMTKDAGINVMGNFMFGLPDDNMQDTFNLAKELQCEYVNFYVALPYPGSQWYESLEDKPTDWSSFDQFSKNICADPEIVRFRDRAFTEYFNDYEYQQMIKNKFGVQAVDHIGEMLKWKLRK